MSVKSADGIKRGKKFRASEAKVDKEKKYTVEEALKLCAELGFANTFHFSRVFKSVFGISPDEFRSLR